MFLYFLKPQKNTIWPNYLLVVVGKRARSIRAQGLPLNGVLPERWTSRHPSSSRISVSVCGAGLNTSKTYKKALEHWENVDRFAHVSYDIQGGPHMLKYFKMIIGTILLQVWSYRPPFKRGVRTASSNEEVFFLLALVHSHGVKIGGRRTSFYFNRYTRHLGGPRGTQLGRAA